MSCSSVRAMCGRRRVLVSHNGVSFIYVVLNSEMCLSNKWMILFTALFILRWEAGELSERRAHRYGRRGLTFR